VGDDEFQSRELASAPEEEGGSALEKKTSSREGGRGRRRFALLWDMAFRLTPRRKEGLEVRTQGKNCQKREKQRSFRNAGKTILGEEEQLAKVAEKKRD